jgi:hypothetical protein
MTLSDLASIGTFVSGLAFFQHKIGLMEEGTFRRLLGGQAARLHHRAYVPRGN